ncbi:hypothetical protein [Methylorubrum extorquens]|uniref:Uncharacterized protein n=1 Tax=Methylorubrum extorquens TaxID=408 RepID=A0AAX3WDP1_METEX|nr:hypothetical protein [Methylorubrum extorquens]WHQ68606.1 hypothetical protein KEC54_19845 [Methylorubrum extorquens]
MSRIDAEMTTMVQALAGNGGPPGVAVEQMVERLRRLEEEARLEGAGRETLQKLMSARRVLGDRMALGQLPAAFAPE